MFFPSFAVFPLSFSKRNEYPSYVEEASIVQFSPRGGNGTMLASSDVVVPVAGLEPARLAALDFELFTPHGTQTNSAPCGGR